ncbi:MAG: CopG family transcriptional regulator [Deltaproteobacteria bacterium]|nr:CopG family transcriptional regulator [Deltaproteobacteria bacterium]
MAGKETKQDVISFKVDKSLGQALAKIPNRSEFIRLAVLAALDNVCPLCQGTGLLTLNQREHWKTFAVDHSVEKCDRCQAVHLVCSAGGD